MVRVKAMLDRVPIYVAFMRAAFLAMLAYRLRYATGIFTYLMFVTVNYFIWQAVYAHQEPGAMLGGFSLPEMITYVAVGWMSRTLYFSNIDFDIDNLVRTGEISAYLIRPVNFQFMMISRALGELLFRALFFTIPVSFVIVMIFPVLLPANLLNGFAFCVSICGAFVILAQINFLVGLGAFALKSISGIIRAKYFFVQLCSGLMIPLSFFPEWARNILEFLPFQDIAYTPLRIYLGKIPHDLLLFVLGKQLLWAVVLFVIGRYFWGKALERLTLQGG